MVLKKKASKVSWGAPADTEEGTQAFPAPSRPVQPETNPPSFFSVVERIVPSAESPNAVADLDASVDGSLPDFDALKSTLNDSPHEHPHAVAGHVFTAEDGDVELQAKDGQKFTAHVHMLKASSRYFSERFPWHRLKDGPLIVNQSGFAVRTLLALIYPSQEPPQISKLEQLIDVLEAAQAWEVTSYAAIEWFAARIAAEEHPLRACALASLYGNEKVKRQAIDQYLRAASDPLDDIPNEMKLADGRQALMLVAAKRRALTSARAVYEAVSWECSSCLKQASQPQQNMFGQTVAPSVPNMALASHATPLWLNDLRDRAMLMNPLSHDASSDLSIEVSFTRHPPCQHSSASFSSTAGRQAREQLRKKLADILSTEVSKLV